MLERLRQTYYETGKRLHPVTSLEDAADLLEAAAAVPAHVLDRNERVWARLTEAGSAMISWPKQTLGRLLSSRPTCAGFRPRMGWFLSLTASCAYFVAVLLRLHTTKVGRLARPPYVYTRRRHRNDAAQAVP